jgi:hypothetical protein
MDKAPSRNWSDEDSVRLLELLDQGWSDKQIADALDFPVCVVTARRILLGLPRGTTSPSAPH